MDSEKFQIVRPDVQYQQPFLSYLEAFEAAGEAYQGKTAAAAHKDFQGYLDILERQARGIDNEYGFNREQVYWLLIADGQIIADSRLRYPITDLVEREHGHVGVTVHPGFRRLGCASFLAEFIRAEAVAMGMDHLTCLAAQSNLPSRRLISNFEGDLVDESVEEDSGQVIYRYRIELA